MNLMMQLDLPEIEERIEVLSCTLSETPSDHPCFPTWLALLGVAYSLRFDLLAEPDDIDSAIEYTSIALTLTPDDDSNMTPLLDTQGMYYSKRYRRQGREIDVEKAIEYGNLALALTPEGDSQLSGRFSNLGGSHSYRFERLGELDDLDKAIEYGTRGVDLAPGDDPSLASQLDNLGVFYSYRFQRLGELQDLDKSINLGCRALGLTPHGDPETSRRLANLGASHKIRFERLGESGDLEKAIQYESHALDLTPSNYSDLSARLTNLAVSHKLRFRRFDKLDDLKMAIEYTTRAIALVSSRHPLLPTQLMNLGEYYSHRFQRTGELDDLEQAIECQSRAVTLTPDGHPHLSARLANLGTAHRYRYRELGEPTDMEKALDYGLRALALTPDGHPSLPLQFHNLARSSILMHQHTNDPSHIQHALGYFRKASQSLTGSPRDRFHHAIAWAALARKHGALNCLEAFQTTIDLLPQFIWLGATTSQRYEDLSTTQSLAVAAASAAITSSDHTLALEWLEHARCVVWNQSLMLRSPIHQLHSFHPELADRLQIVANQLHHAGTQSRESQTLLSSSLNLEQVAQQHHRLAQEYDFLLSEIRGLSGFDSFLRPMKANDLVHAARNGPIVVINCDKDRCDALLVLPRADTISHIPLPDFTEEKARQARSEIEKSLRRKGVRERGFKIRSNPDEKDDFAGALAILWNTIVKPILDSLGYTNEVSKEKLPHITWCPTGVLSFLPLHAAGDYDQPRSRVFNYVVSSYTPTLAALLTSNPSSLNTSSNSRLLAVGLEFTPGRSHLPGATVELACLKKRIQDMVTYSELVNDQATSASVLDAMEQHDWVHLACHAHQNTQDPTKSGFFLYGGVLDLAAINQRSFKNKGLAFLSACQTATGDEKLADEAIHLAAGLLMAGYPSVIATMWSVADEDAPFLADRVYSQLLKNWQIGNGEAGKALHGAVAELRERVGEKEFTRWVPYIHLGS
ncbi:unnamed protein product [Rhizoctonia solani]|uniref:CHAT domain-containing protein n=1 Tax=Rhizoctonia solani TaxID=456999 RepID=A0A8H3I2D1_9AGAM|nr:unnamed protein product [Rhizoctonia solani]